MIEHGNPENPVYKEFLRAPSVNEKTGARYFPAELITENTIQNEEAIPDAEEHTEDSNAGGEQERGIDNAIIGSDAGGTRDGLAGPDRVGDGSGGQVSGGVH